MATKKAKKKTKGQKKGKKLGAVKPLMPISPLSAKKACEIY